MTEIEKTITNKTGQPPGTLIHVGKKKSEHVKISVIDFTADQYKHTVCANIEECFQYRDTHTVSWINIDGLHHTETIAAIGKHFNLHPLLLEDVLNTKHRPKMEDFGEYLFLTLKMLGISKEGNTVVSEQVSFVLGNNWVISFQEQEGDVFQALRTRMSEGKGIIRQQGADYLLYRLIDTIVDNYFYVTEYFSEATEKLEEVILKDPSQKNLQEIQRLKKMLLGFRKSVMPLREAVTNLQKDNTHLITEHTIRYLRDVYEHIIQVSDSMDTQREMLATIMDLYLSGVSNKMNEVMKVLTVIATIFIPLTFIAGIYGMNFDNMPELHWQYGYHMVWGAMVVVIIFMLYYFRNKRWL